MLNIFLIYIYIGIQFLLEHAWFAHSQIINPFANYSSPLQLHYMSPL